MLFLLDMTELIVDLVNVRALSITRRRLRRGDPGRSRPLPRSLLLTARGAAAVFLVIIVADLVLIGYAYLTTRTSSLPLSEWDPDFPLLTLSEMEGDGSWTPEANYDFSFGIEDSPFADIETHFNQVDITWSPSSQAPTRTTLSTRRAAGPVGTPAWTSSTTSFLTRRAPRKS